MKFFQRQVKCPKTTLIKFLYNMSQSYLKIKLLSWGSLIFKYSIYSLLHFRQCAALIYCNIVRPDYNLLQNWLSRIWVYKQILEFHCNWAKYCLLFEPHPLTICIYKDSFCYNLKRNFNLHGNYVLYIIRFLCQYKQKNTTKILTSWHSYQLHYHFQCLS